MARGDPHTCPGCGTTKLEEDWQPDVRNLGVRETVYGSASVTSVAFRCECGTVWGHEE